jgi:hypothetical protein
MPEDGPEVEITEVSLSWLGLLFSLRRRVVRDSAAAATAAEDIPAPVDASPTSPCTLASEISGLCRDSLPVCVARLARAYTAGVGAARKRRGEAGREPATPSLATLGLRLAQPSPKYYVVLRTSAAELVVEVFRDWVQCKEITCRSPDFRVPHDTAVFHAFHFRAEVEEYFRGADLLDLLPVGYRR